MNMITGPFAQRVEPADAHRLVRDEGGQVVEGALHAPAQADEDLVADDLVQGLAQEPDAHEHGQEARDKEPDVQHVRVHAQGAVRITREETSPACGA
jgi:hypothetical protein